jgi:hypothetical protein
VHIGSSDNGTHRAGKPSTVLFSPFLLPLDRWSRLVDPAEAGASTASLTRALPCPRADGSNRQLVEQANENPRRKKTTEWLKQPSVSFDPRSTVMPHVHSSTVACSQGDSSPDPTYEVPRRFGSGEHALTCTGPPSLAHATWNLASWRFILYPPLYPVPQSVWKAAKTSSTMENPF